MTSSNKQYQLEQVGIRIVREPPLYSSEPLRNPESAVRLLSELLRQYDRELLCVVNLRNDLKPINVNVVSMGTINSSIAHPREILKSAILSNAASIMLFHNHPSGNLTPSEEDITLTDRMTKACDILGIPIVDHIIIGNDDRYYSFMENKVLKVPEVQYAKAVEDIHFSHPSVGEPEPSLIGLGREQKAENSERNFSELTAASGTAKEKEDRFAARRQVMKELTDRLEQGVQDVFTSDKYRAYLSCMSKFHHYSLNNTLLIAMQKPDASLVAGYQAWKQKHGRQVRKGEKGIKILAPAPYKVKEEKDVIDPATRQPMLSADGKPQKETVTVERPAFKIATVFDVRQTEGKDLPTLGVEELTGDVQGFQDFFEALKRTSPVSITLEQIPSSAKGYYHLEENRIAIQDGMSEVQTIKTAIHEISHAMLHSRERMKESGVVKNDRTREVEAESIAFCVASHYGIDTSDYSFGYIAGWSSGKETAELKASLETIRSETSELITSIDEHLQEIQKEHDVLENRDAKIPVEKRAAAMPEHRGSVLAAIKALEKDTAAKLSPSGRTKACRNEERT